MTPYVGNIETDTQNNTNFRHVLFTGSFSQLVVMSLLPNEDIGAEVHDHVDQFFRVESGTGTAVIEDQQYPLSDGTALLVPAGTRHNIINTSSKEPLKLYTIYSPPNHPDGITHVTKADALEAENHH